MNKVNFSCVPMYNHANNQILAYACSTKNIENFYANDRGVYNKDTYYKKGDQVSFDGQTYEVIDQATNDGALGYTPNAYPNVWKSLGTSVSNSSGSSNWDENKFYKLNDVVMYKGLSYKVRDQATGDGAKGYAPDNNSNIWTPIFPEWVESKYYLLNDTVAYKGRNYKVRDQATGSGAQGYKPDSALNIWTPI
jgi:hypothetical protein